MTVHLAVLLPSLVVTVISAVPALRAATLPVVSTVATAVSLDFQITVLSDAFAGETVAVNVSFAPTTSEVVVLFNATLVGLITPPLLVPLVPLLVYH